MRRSTHIPSIGMPWRGLQTGEFVDRWQILLWNKALLPFFTSKDSKFLKGSNLKTFEGSPKAIKHVVYRFASLPTIFLSCHHCSPLCLSFHLLFLVSSSFIRYIFHELVKKDSLNSAFLPAYFEKWMNDSSNKFIYTSHR